MKILKRNHIHVQKPTEFMPYGRLKIHQSGGGVSWKCIDNGCRNVALSLANSRSISLDMSEWYVNEKRRTITRDCMMELNREEATAMRDHLTQWLDMTTPEFLE